MSWNVALVGSSWLTGGCFGVQEMRTWKQAEEAGKKAGFVLLESLDLAVASPVTLGWYAPKASPKD